MKPRKPKKQSYSSLKDCLRCANAEAAGYLDRLQGLEGIRADRDRWEQIARGSDRLNTVLIRALEDAQKRTL